MILYICKWINTHIHLRMYAFKMFSMFPDISRISENVSKKQKKEPVAGLSRRTTYKVILSDRYTTILYNTRI